MPYTTRSSPCRYHSTSPREVVGLPFAQRKSRKAIGLLALALFSWGCDAEPTRPALEPTSPALQTSGSAETILQPGDTLSMALGDRVQVKIERPASEARVTAFAGAALTPTTGQSVATDVVRNNNWIQVTIASSKGFDATRLTGKQTTFGTAEHRSGVARRANGSYMIKYGDFDSHGRRGIQLYFDVRALQFRSGDALPIESMYLLGVHPDAGPFTGTESGSATAPEGPSGSWSSLNTKVATVSQDGVVESKGVGTARITYGSGQVHESVFVKVTPGDVPPPVAGGKTVAELPRSVVDTRMPAMSGRVIRVPARGDLQGALDAARPGDVVELQAGATYEGSFTLRPKTGEGWIVIRSSAHDRLPEGRRVGPSDSRYLAKLVGGQRNQRVLKTAAGAHHYRIIGLEIALAGKGIPSLVNTLVEFGAPDEEKGATVPHHLILDRTFVHGTERQNLMRCVILNSAWSAVIDSHLSDCHAQGLDSQAIVGWSGPGPFKIQNNYLAGAGENIMFGGARVGPDGIPPSDIEIRGNHIHKPLSWKGKWTVKNLFELKIAERVLVEGNVFENMWADAQVGFAINLKSENRNKAAYPNLATRDVTFRNNKIVNSRFGASIIGGASTKEKTGSGRTERIVFQNNMWDVEDRAFQMSGAPNVVLEKNTATGRVMIEGVMENLIMRDNLITGSVKGSGVPEGLGALEERAPGWVFSGNAIVGVDGSRYPKGNEFPRTLSGYAGIAGVVDGVLQSALSSLSLVR